MHQSCHANELPQLTHDHRPITPAVRTYRQIAEILGIEEAAVDTRISRARRLLREELEQIQDGETGTSRSARRAPTMNGQRSHNRLEVQP